MSEALKSVGVDCKVRVSAKAKFGLSGNFIGGSGGYLQDALILKQL